MTCEELHWYFEDHLRDAEVRSARGAVADHIVACADCSRFVRQQHELGRNLRAIRESVGPFPESLDASVLLQYRRHREDGEDSRLVFRLRPLLTWRLAAVATSMLAIAGILFLLIRKTDTTAGHPPMVQPAQEVPVAETPKSPLIAAFEPTRTTSAPAKRMRSSHSKQGIPRSTIRAAQSLPEGFRSLMYCDTLSCPEAMDVIRVQLPSTAMPRQVSGLIQSSKSVTADVLVGADGIARGIRLEEIEF
jgi:hypothetical protein